MSLTACTVPLIDICDVVNYFFFNDTNFCTSLYENFVCHYIIRYLLKSIFLCALLNNFEYLGSMLLFARKVLTSASVHIVLSIKISIK